jgi:hypothetical protein
MATDQIDQPSALVVPQRPVLGFISEAMPRRLPKTRLRLLRQL